MSNQTTNQTQIGRQPAKAAKDSAERTGFERFVRAGESVTVDETPEHSECSKLYCANCGKDLPQSDMRAGDDLIAKVDCKHSVWEGDEIACTDAGHECLLCSSPQDEDERGTVALKEVKE